MASVAESESTVSVECPTCGGATCVRASDGGADVVARQYVAAWGDHEAVTCPTGHRFWVYVC